LTKFIIGTKSVISQPYLITNRDNINFIMSKWAKHWDTIKKDWEGFGILTKIGVLISLLLSVPFFFLIPLDWIGLI